MLWLLIAPINLIGCLSKPVLITFMLYNFKITEVYKYGGKTVKYLEIRLTKASEFTLLMYLEDFGWKAQNIKKENDSILLTFSRNLK